jgi:Mor family transcriptional regulator
MKRRRMKLTWEDVQAIRASNLRQSELARKYRVSESYIWRIRMNRRRRKA